MYPRLLAPDRPDWRWARVAELSQYSNTQAAARLRNEDEAVRACFEFKRKLDRGLPDPDCPIFAAHTIYLNQPHTRYLIEGMLLGGADDKVVADVSHQVPIVVKAYHDAFFDVRDHLKHTFWIVANLFNGEAHLAHKGDRSGIKLRLAWICGHEIFQQLVELRLNGQQRTALREKIKDIFHAHLAEFALSAPYQIDAAPEWLRIILGDEASSAKGAGDYEECISSFLDGLGITVADGTDKRNLSLPAREPRSVQCEVVQHV